ncbi:MAG: energy-coupling factor ABC transporter ATP-binding protein [Desulfatibacillaceae bacterium]
MEEGGDALIRFENASHRFADGAYGIHGVNLLVGPGEFVLVVGRNGSGKTTLLRHMNGLVAPTEGRVLVRGRDTRKASRFARESVGMVFQHPDTQIVGETVALDVAFGPENLGLPRAEVDARTAWSIEAVGLGELGERAPHLLSGGEKRRLAVAGILAMRPAAVVFDEPFNSLDRQGVMQVLREMVRLRESGVTVVVTTHDLDKVLAHADRLIIMEHGEVAGDGAPAGLLEAVARHGVHCPIAARLGVEACTWLE